ncbi:MAG: aminotransferase class I/II-fold pyridoxal phosphate-dependent enzyme [Patescibacteria group bacterium]
MKFPHLEKTSLWSGFSRLGKSISTPKGIFYWSARAKTEAEIDGTIGIAQDDDGTISHLKVAEPWAGEKIMQRVPKGKIFGYAPIEGVESLRKKWLARILKQHPELEKAITLPVVTNGITHSIAIASRLFLEPGETLITADKSWENYEHIFTGSQGVLIHPFALFTQAGEFHIPALLEACRQVAVKQKKVVLLLNFPHNQTGFMPTSQQFEELAQKFHNLCREFSGVPFVLLLDDAYEGYVYDDTGQKFSPLSQLFAPLPNLSIAKMDGISKVMLAYGYRVGFLTFVANSLDGTPFTDDFLQGLWAEAGTKIGGCIRAEISQTGHHGQVLADALMDDIATVEVERGEVIARLGARWKMMMKTLDECYAKYGKQKVWVDPCNGGFFAYLNLAADLDAKQVAERLLKEKKVGVVPSGQGIRVAFAGVSEAKVPRMITAIFEVVHG